MFHTEDMGEQSSHPFNLELIEQEQYYCQRELLIMCNKEIITENELAMKLVELKRLLKVMYGGICDLHNLVEVNKE